MASLRESGLPWTSGISCRSSCRSRAFMSSILTSRVNYSDITFRMKFRRPRARGGSLPAGQGEGPAPAMHVPPGGKTPTPQDDPPGHVLPADGAHDPQLDDGHEHPLEVFPP